MNLPADAGSRLMVAWSLADLGARRCLPHAGLATWRCASWSWAKRGDEQMDSWTEQACDTSGRHTQSDHILSAHPLACKLVQSSDQIQSRTAIHWSLCGVLVFGSVSRPLLLLLRPPPSLCHTHTIFHTQLCHTQSLTHTQRQFVTHNFVTHNFVTHTQSFTTTLSHTHTIFHTTTLSYTHNLRHTHTQTIFHTQLCHTQLCHTHNLSHNNFVTHTHNLSHNNFVTQLCRTQSLTHIHNFVAHNLWQQTQSSTHTHNLWHATLSHTIFDTHTIFTYNVALAHIDFRFVWQAWHLWHWAGSGGALGSRWSPVTPQHRRGTWWHPRSRCVAGGAVMELGWIRWRAWVPPVTLWHFAWQAWHLVTSALQLRGRRGTWWHPRHPPSSCVAGVARRGTWWHLHSLCVAGVALMALETWTATCDVLRLRQVRGLVTKLHARFHFQCVGFETAVTCFLSFSIHQLCAAGCLLICNMVLFNLDAAVVALTQRGKNTCIA